MIKDFDFGLTNDEDRYDLAVQYRIDAMNDGWLIQDPHKMNPLNLENMTKDDFVMHVVHRKENFDMWKYMVSINIWGPDKLSIIPPGVYNWELIKKGIDHCNLCHADPVQTQRYSFAGRCCINCIESARSTHEKPGWTE